MAGYEVGTISVILLSTRMADLVDLFTHLQHHYHDLVISSMHIDLD